LKYIHAHKDQLANNGFTIIENIYSQDDVKQIIVAIEKADSSRETFRKSTELFAIRQFLKEIPGIKSLIFNDNLKGLIRNFFGENYFVVKSIYFDKPETSNWYVSYHQDLTISVDKKVEMVGFGSWTNKQNQFAVQPPVDILRNIFTLRIHLDNTNEDNGALKVIRGSHLQDIRRPETITSSEDHFTCNVPEGGVMIMKPLLLHSSGRTVNNKKRRVIHIEFSNLELPGNLNWSERIN
jgi:ectoine hydroxylase-related dioxygenase (phytanoyl-CoA dioxygenase family)